MICSVGEAVAKRVLSLLAGEQKSYNPHKEEFDTL